MDGVVDDLDIVGEEGACFADELKVELFFKERIAGTADDGLYRCLGGILYRKGTRGGRLTVRLGDADAECLGPC